MNYDASKDCSSYRLDHIYLSVLCVVPAGVGSEQLLDEVNLSFPCQGIYLIILGSLVIHSILFRWVKATHPLPSLVLWSNLD